MMTTNMMKRTAIAALIGAMGYGVAGVAEVSASAPRADQRVTPAAFERLDGRTDVQQLAWGENASPAKAERSIHRAASIQRLLPVPSLARSSQRIRENLLPRSVLSDGEDAFLVHI